MFLEYTRDVTILPLSHRVFPIPQHVNINACNTIVMPVVFVILNCMIQTTYTFIYLMHLLLISYFYIKYIINIYLFDLVENKL